ncbi:MAG: signal peptidase II [Thermodesulfobacteriota bacterium]
MIKARLSVSIALFVIVTDQLTKFLIRTNLALHEKIRVLPFLDIVHYQNSGAAFGILNSLDERLRMGFFVFVLIVAAVVLVALMRKASEDNKLLISALSMILGGAIGNSMDRIYAGSVTDFLDLHWFGHQKLHWAAFNISDCAITVGVAIVLYDTFRSARAG